jgi:hypothetical protein
MWTEAWKRLLGRPDALGEVARSSLCGLTAQLRRVAEARLEPDDGHNDCLAVLDGLKDLLAPSADCEIAATAVVTGHGPRLAALAEEFLADRDMARALRYPRGESAGASDSKLWSLILMGLLRVEATVASRWRARAIEAALEAGFGLAPPSHQLPLSTGPPADEDGVLGPDLILPTGRQAGEPVAVGIRFDDRQPFDHRFTPPPSCGADLAFLARVAATYAALGEVDDQLWHAPARSSVLRAFSGEEQKVYLDRLADGFHAVIAAESRFAATPSLHNAENLLALWLDLDETFHSLVPLPVCVETSWWSRTQSAARGALLGVFERIRRSGVGLDPAYRILKGPYEGVHTQSAHDIRWSGPGPSGQVVACLRVYVESARGPRPGRVVFVPP